MSPETFVDVNVVFIIVARFYCEDYGRSGFYLEDDESGPSETSVNFQTAGRHVAESGNLMVVALLPNCRFVHRA
jgi:hypothetical protein